MKKCIACLMALPLLLAACGAQGPQNAQSGQTTETAVSTETAPETPAPAGITGQLRSMAEMVAAEDGLYSVLTKYSEEENLYTFYLVKTDYDTAVQEEVAKITLQGGIYYRMAVWSDTVELELIENADTNEPTGWRYIVDTSTGNVDRQPMDSQLYPGWYDEAALYELDYNTGSRIIRLDRATNEVSYIPLPVQTFGLYGVGNRWLIQRIVSPSSLPDPADRDMYTAVMRNSEMEMDLLDPATGEMEKLFTYATDGEDYFYYGQRDGVPYFSYYTNDEKGNPVPAEIKKLENGAMVQVLALENEYTSMQEFADENGELQWFLQDDGRTMEVLDLETGQTGCPATEAQDYVTRGYPARLLPGGKVLVNYGRLDAPDLWEGVSYAFIDRAAYLAGSTDYTPITMFTGE